MVSYKHTNKFLLISLLSILGSQAAKIKKCSPNCEVAYVDIEGEWSYENNEKCLCIPSTTSTKPSFTETSTVGDVRKGKGKKRTTTPRPHLTRTSTTRSTGTPCPTGSGSYWRVPQCLGKHGHYYYDNFSGSTCNPGTFVCFIPCSEVKATTTKPLSTPITFEDIYCGCEINGEYTNDLKKCEKMSRGLSNHGGYIYGNQSEKTTTTTPRPHPTRTSTTRSTVTACPTGSGSYYRIPYCLRRDGHYYYNNHVEGTCRPGTFVCFLPCSATTTKVSSTSISDGNPYCGCEINGEYTTDLKKCEKMTEGLRTAGGYIYGNQSGKTTTTTPRPHPTKPLLTKTKSTTTTTTTTTSTSPRPHPTKPLLTKTKSTTTTTTTTTSTSPRPHPTKPSSIVTACANGSGSSWRVPQCLAKHGHYYYDNYSGGSCKPGTFVCFIPCSEVKTTTKLLPTPITFDDIYCGCEINGVYTSDLKKCKRISRGLSVHGGHIYGDPSGNKGITSTTPRPHPTKPLLTKTKSTTTTTTTFTTPRPHPARTSTTTIIKPPCPTGTGSSWRIPDCVAKGGIYYYNNYLGKDTCSPGPFICYIPCSSSSTPANSENSVQINGKSYCGCEFNGEYTTNLRSCKYIADNTFKTTRYQKNFEKKTTTKRTTKRITTSTITISKKKHGEN